MTTFEQAESAKNLVGKILVSFDGSGQPLKIAAWIAGNYEIELQDGRKVSMPVDYILQNVGTGRLKFQA